MYLWLRKGAEDQFSKLKEAGIVGNLTVQRAPISGQVFLSVPYFDVGCSTNDRVPPELSKLVRRVTAVVMVVGTSYEQGLYRHGKSVLVVQIVPTKEHEPIVQKVCISATGVNACNHIYRLFRQGELAIVETWNSGKSILTD